MKVDKIIPCICCDHDPDSGDSVYYGMPQLKVCGGKPHTYFEAYCPSCGRGGMFQYASAFLALRAWNEMQDKLRNPIMFVDLTKKQKGNKTMFDKKEQVKKIAELLKSIDMSGYDEEVHGDFEENVAEYLVNNGVSVDPTESVKIKDLATLEKLTHEAMIDYLDYLEEQDQKGLIDNQKKSAFIAQYIADHSREDGGTA